ncbi:MAG: amidohydrolase family protein [Thermoplasmata archaeon]
MDKAIIDTLLITFSDDGLGIIEDGAVGVEDDEIVFVGNTDELDLKNVEKVIDGKEHITMPGLVNAHTHTGSTLLRGGAQDVPEIEWMNKAIGPIAKHLTEEDRTLGSKLGVLEGLRTGTTTFAEYKSDVKETVDEVYQPFNVRVGATETINEIVSSREKLGPRDLYEFSPEKGEDAIKKTEDLFDEYEDSDLVDCYYGPQALDMVSLETLEEVWKRAEDRSACIHMHVAQGEREKIQIKERYGSSTVEVLDENDMLNDNLIAAHCHGTSDEEKRLMTDKGVKMVGCPSSISMIDGIVPPVNDFLKFGGKAAIGSDQAPGPGTHNMFREMRTISLLTKVRDKDPTKLPCWESLKLGCKGGAEVLGMKDKIGSLEVGKKADIITVDISKVNMTPSVSIPFHNFIPNLVYSSTGYEVDNVIINGKMIMEDGEFKDIDEEKIIQKADERAKDVFEDAKEDWKEAGSYLVKKTDEGFI